MRLFLALKTTPYEDELFEVENKLKPIFQGVKWVGKQNLHVTLKFLGDVKEFLMHELQSVIDDVSHKFKPFDFSISGISGFPDIISARVLFFSIDDPENFIISIMKNIDVAFKIFGIQLEKSYVPHITFARVKYGRIDLSPFSFPSFNLKVHASGMVLFESILKPEGPIYKEIFEFEFI